MSDPAAELGRAFLDSVVRNLRSYKKRADQALARLDEADFAFTPDPESNSVAVLIQHLAGNMVSRWTDFLTSDGEKPDRNRDAEFVPAGLGKEGLLARWEEGWSCLFAALDALRPEDLLRTVRVRGQEHTALHAVLMQLPHYAEHVGQIVYVAKHRRWQSWESLTVPKPGRPGPRS